MSFTRKYTFTTIILAALFMPSHATAQMSQSEILAEVERQLVDWKNQGRVDDVKIISSHKSDLMKQVRDGNIDLQAIVDEHNYHHKDGKFYGKTQQKNQPTSTPPKAKARSRQQTATIPKSNKPIAAYTRLEGKWLGFPAILVQTATMDLYFPNGNTVTCSNWDPSVLAPTSGSVGSTIKGCEVKKGKPKGKKNTKFRKGETIDIAFGNIGGIGFDMGGSSSSQISRSDLRMTKDGRIAIGKFRGTSVSSGGNGVGTKTQSRPLIGSYTLDGHIITITTDDGEVFHGFIGATSNSGSNKIDHVYLNGEHFWDRKK